MNLTREEATPTDIQICLLVWHLNQGTLKYKIFYWFVLVRYVKCGDIIKIIHTFTIIWTLCVYSHYNYIQLQQFL